MKRLVFTGILLLVALLSLVVCKAHIPVQQCSALPNVIITWTLVDNSDEWVVISGNNVSVTLSIQPVNGKVTTAFNGAVGKTYTFYFYSDTKRGKPDKLEWSGTYKVTTPCQLNLPITLTSFRAKDLGYGNVGFTWDLDMEHDVSYYEVWELNEYGEHKILQVNSLGDTDNPRTYNQTWEYGTYLQAGFGLGICLIVLSILIPAVINKRKWFTLIVGMGLILTTSCHKTNIEPVVRKWTGTKYFRLKEVDKDGNIYTFSTIQVKLN